MPLTVGLLIRAVLAIISLFAVVTAVNVITVLQKTPEPGAPIKDITTSARVGSYALLVIGLGYLLSQARGLQLLRRT